MRNYEANVIIRLSVNSLKNGGKALKKGLEPGQDGVWAQIWTGDETYANFNGHTENVPIIHSIFLKFPNSGKLEPEKTYNKINAHIRSYEDIKKNFNINKKFILQGGKNSWATGEILEILDENETTNN